MSFTRTGIILYVERYRECVAFYADRLGLEVLFSTPELTCFDFGDSYLMVEQDDREPSTPRSGWTTWIRASRAPAH